MLDIKFLKDNLELVKKNIERKNQKEKLRLVDEVVKKDLEWRSLKSESDNLRKKRNDISKQINNAKKAGKDKDAEKLLKEAKKIPEEISKIEEISNKLLDEIDEIMKKIPNIISDLVPVGKDSSENQEKERFGKIKKFDFEIKNHAQIGEELGVLDFTSSAESSGNGFYYMQGDLALMNQALIRFAIDKMISKGFTYVETPLMLRGKVIKNVTDLNDQKNQIYKIDSDDGYLIGTSEHSLIGRFIDKIIPEKSLPIKHTSYSMCFRKEIGSHGIDEKGLFRTHQFNKIEMIVICKPEESNKFYEYMQKITIEIFTDLGIPIRVLQICSGDLGDLKHNQVDIEAWSPRKEEFFEVGSCSNLTDAQARRLKIRSITGKGEKYIPHTLNNTAIATSRALVAIMENYQQKDGSIKIPEVLQGYMNGKKVINKLE